MIPHVTQNETTWHGPQTPRNPTPQLLNPKPQPLNPNRNNPKPKSLTSTRTVATRRELALQSDARGCKQRARLCSARPGRALTARSCCVEREKEREKREGGKEGEKRRKKRKEKKRKELPPHGSYTPKGATTDRVPRAQQRCLETDSQVLAIDSEGSNRNDPHLFADEDDLRRE
eukprot:3941747-Rhodomonas_salina.5